MLAYIPTRLQCWGRWSAHSPLAYFSLLQSSGLSHTGTGHWFTSNGDMASKVVSAPAIEMTNQKMKKLVLIKEQNEKELTAKVENYPFLQQKLKALEAILKRKKITGKLPSFEKMDESSVLQKASDNKKLKDDSDVFFYNFFFFFYLFFNYLFFFFFFFFFNIN